MKNEVKRFIQITIENLIHNSSNEQKIDTLIKKHHKKIHFIPIRYRIFSGLLQSMNIQFGNFIEKLLHIIIENEDNLSIKAEISGKRDIELSMTKSSDEAIDNFITYCQNNSYNDIQLLDNFTNLIKICLDFEKNISNKDISIKHDIDVLFYDKNNKYYYLEVKYNDDHDTGKYADINRKFIKSYIGICNKLQIYNIKDFKPILYYFTKKRMKGNIYLPEKEFIYRGDKLFEEFFSIKYDQLDNTLSSIGNDLEIIKLFDNLYDKIRNDITIE